jgi:hypothetical protein
MENGIYVIIQIFLSQIFYVMTSEDLGHLLVDQLLDRLNLKISNAF